MEPFMAALAAKQLRRQIPVLGRLDFSRTAKPSAQKRNTMLSRAWLNRNAIPPHEVFHDGAEETAAHAGNAVHPRRVAEPAQCAPDHSAILAGEAHKEHWEQ
jgi:hypothetical protein